MNKSQDGWKWLGGKCIDPKAQCALKRDGSEFIEGKCLSLEDVCKRKAASDFVWKDGTCLSPQKICEQKGFEYTWKSTKTCGIKTFMEFCQDISAPDTIKYTINADLQ